VESANVVLTAPDFDFQRLPAGVRADLYGMWKIRKNLGDIPVFKVAPRLLGSHRFRVSRHFFGHRNIVTPKPDNRIKKNEQTEPTE
jgi:hypothetical protein